MRISAGSQTILTAGNTPKPWCQVSIRCALAACLPGAALNRETTQTIFRPNPGAERAGFEFYNLNAITPETESSTWYFYAHSRNFAQDDPNMDEEFRHELRAAFRKTSIFSRPNR